MEEEEKDWKLKLRYGKLVTPYQHFTVIASGEVRKEMEGFDCPIGDAVMGIKVWAGSTDESADMIQSVGEQIGFVVTGDIEVYNSDPQEPPRESPYGYDINFTPF